MIQIRLYILYIKLNIEDGILFEDIKSFTKK